VSAVAAFLADEFSIEQESGSKVTFLESPVVVPLDGSKPFNLEDALPAAEFRRFSNNIGWWEADADELLMRFMRWTHEVTEGHMMVVDLQGIKTDDGFILTDPCILCADVTRFGSGNLGPRALERCLTSLAARLDRPAEEPLKAFIWESMPSAVPWVPTPHVPDKLRWLGGASGSVAEVLPEAYAPCKAGVASTTASVASAMLSAAFCKAGIQRSKASVAPAPSAASGIALKKSSEVLDIDSVLKGLIVPPQMAFGKVLPSEWQIKAILTEARNTFLAQPALLELEAPLNILGDIHGQFPDLLRWLELGNVHQSSYLCLGDYVDRGKQSLEVIISLLALKVKRPENVFLLRGNHECASITRIYGFYDECKRRYNIKLWKQCCDVFNCLPVAACIDEKIFCCHGGLSPELNHFDAVRRITRPCDVPDSGLMCDLLWADPDKDISGWVENDRGVSYMFGHDVVSSFLVNHNLDLIVRAHQVVEDGYEFFANRRLVTLFSAPNYGGEFDNAGGLMEVKDDLTCGFKLVRGVRQVGRR